MSSSCASRHHEITNTAHSHTFQDTDICLPQIQQSHQETDFFQGHTPATCPKVDKGQIKQQVQIF